MLPIVRRFGMLPTYHSALEALCLRLLPRKIFRGERGLNPPNLVRPWRQYSISSLLCTAHLLFIFLYSLAFHLRFSTFSPIIAASVVTNSIVWGIEHSILRFPSLSASERAREHYTEDKHEDPTSSQIIARFLQTEGFLGRISFLCNRRYRQNTRKAIPVRLYFLIFKVKDFALILFHSLI